MTTTPAPKSTDPERGRALVGTREDYQTFPAVPLPGATIEAVPDGWGGHSPQLVIHKDLLAALRLLVRAHAKEPGAAVRYKHRHEDRRLGQALEELGLGTCGMAGGGRGCFAISPRGRQVLLAATAALGPLLAVMGKQRAERLVTREQARIERERELFVEPAERRGAG